MKKILVIDDDPQIVDLIKSRLKANNYEVITALDGKEGLEKTKEEFPHLIILDIAMPRMDGYTFVLELRKDEKLKGLPVIILTAKDKMKELFGMEGLSHYLIKPFIAYELLKKVKELLENEQFCS